MHFEALDRADRREQRPLAHDFACKVYSEQDGTNGGAGNGSRKDQGLHMKVDTTAIEQEIAAYEKQLRQHYSTKSRLMEEIDSLDPDDRHFIARKSDLDDRLYKIYDKIEEVENGLMDARAKK